METETEGKTNAERNSYPQEAPESEDSKTAVEGDLDMAVVATLEAEKSDSNFIKVEGIKEDKPERLKMKIKTPKKGIKRTSPTTRKDKRNQQNQKKHTSLKKLKQNLTIKQMIGKMKKENETKPDTDPDPTDKQNGSENKGSRPDPEPNRTPKKEGIMEVCTRMPHSLKGKMKRDKFTAKGSPGRKFKRDQLEIISSQ